MAKKTLRPTVSHLATSKFSRRGLREYFEYRDLGVSRATGGRAHAHVIRARPARIKHREIAHSKDLEMLEVTAPQRFRTYDAIVR